MTKIREDVLRRLLVSKHFLASGSGQLTPNSDAVAVAKMILSAHDAAELAVAAIADQLGVHGLSDKMFLVDYPSKIKDHVYPKEEFPGVGFLKPLNTARRSFKHEGILPDARTWYRVIENTWNYVDGWCQKYLKLSLDEIDLEELLEDATVRDLYQKAKVAHMKGLYKEALENLGRAFYRILKEFPGIRFPVLGRRHTDHALMLSAFGVRPYDFLNLQEFLPAVSEGIEAGELTVKWETRGTGHPANWTDGNVRFCLEVFIDIALKIQHAPWVPTAVPFGVVFDDMIEARSDGVELWREETERRGLLTRGPVGKTVVMRLQKGQILRGILAPVDNPPRDLQGSPLISALYTLGPQKTVETAEILSVLSKDIPGRFAYVEAKDIEISYVPKEDEFVKKYFPHLFTPEA